jgi:putative ABC transport system permease protein
LVFLALVAAPIGLAGGLGLARALISAFTRQDFYLPFVITPGGLGLAIATYLAAVTLAAVMVAQRIWHFDLVAVLKTRD